MNKLVRNMAVVAFALCPFASCKKDADPLIIVPPSSGSSMQLEGGNGGASAENTVFVDLSTDKQSSVKRNSWDLGFYCGAEFRVILNYSKAAFARATNKTDINAVSAADTVGMQLLFNHGNPQLLSSGLIDDLSGDINKTAIPAISAADADNKVMIINRWNDEMNVRDSNFFKVRILRNNTGYTIQYAMLKETAFKTLQVAKDVERDFVGISFITDKIMDVFPAKKDWDIQWGYGTSKTNFGADVIYPFSDLVTINQLNGVQASSVVYSNEASASDAFSKFNKDSVAKYTLSNNRWVIGSSWRATTGTIGVIKDRFYIIKDAGGNIYKLKFISFTSQDGGTRGRPQIQYSLINN